MQEKSPHVTSVLPAVAPFTDKEFANALEISVERFRDWVLLYSLRGVKKMGTRVIIVDAEEFYASMPDFTQETPGSLGRGNKSDDAWQKSIAAEENNRATFSNRG